MKEIVNVLCHARKISVDTGCLRNMMSDLQRNSCMMYFPLCLQDHKVEEFIGSPLYSVMIISYEMLLRSLDQIQAIEFNLLICDEGHRLKNSSIKTTAALSSLSCERRIILTG